MKNYIEAMIATDGVLNDTQLNQIASQCRSIDGVGQFTRSQHVPRVIWVPYHSGKVQAISILNQFARLGIHASLVGM